MPSITVYYTPSWALKSVLSWMIKLDIAAVARKQAEDNNDRKLSEKMGATENHYLGKEGIKTHFI